MAKTRPDGSPLTPDDREYWDQPYEFQEFPKWLHRVSPTTADVPPVDPRMHDVTTTTIHDLTVQVDLVHQPGIVDSAAVQAALQAAGWVTDSGAAQEAAREAVRREKQRRANEDKDLVKQAVREALEESFLADGRHSSQAASPTDDGPPLSLKATATELGVSEDTVGRMVADGKIRTVMLGKRPKVPVAEVRRLLALPKYQFPDRER